MYEMVKIPIKCEIQILDNKLWFQLEPEHIELSESRTFWVVCGPALVKDRTLHGLLSIPKILKSTFSCVR